MKNKHFLIAVAAILFCGAAVADAPSIDTVMHNFDTAANSVSQKLVTTAKRTALAALLLQWLLSYWKDMFSGAEIPSIIGKMVGMMMWCGASIWMIDNIDLMNVLYKQYLALAGEISGLQSGFSPLSIIRKGQDVVSATHDALAKKAGASWYAFGENVLAAGSLIVTDVVILGAFFVLALSLFMVSVEFSMILAVTPLSLALIPLSALRDQGIAPLKGLLSVGLRVLILGVVMAVAQSLSDTVIASMQAKGIDGAQGSSILSRMFEYLAGILGCAVMSIYSGKIAAAIASGSASFSGADLVSGVGAAKDGASAVKASGQGLVESAKSAGSKVSGAASGLRSNLGGGGGGQGLGGFGGPSGGLNVSPTGVPSKDSGSHGFGKPLSARPPGEASPARSAPSSPSAGSSQAAGNASTASIGGASPASNASGDQGQSGSAWSQFGKSAGSLNETLQRDQAGVSVNVRLGGE